MRPFEVPEENRAAYHAAASIASNLLVALEESAAELLERAGVEDARSCWRRWCCAPPPTGPSAAPRRSPARSPAATRRPSSATAPRIAELAPELLPIYEALCRARRGVAASADQEEVPA